MAFLLGAYVLVTAVELVSGLVASTWTAFFNEKKGNEWTYGIFVVYFLFSLLISGVIGRQTCCRRQNSNLDYTAALDGITGISTIVTMFLFLGLYYYNVKVLNQKGFNNVILYSGFVYAVALALVILLVITSCMVENEPNKGRYKTPKNFTPGSVDASIACMVEHRRNNPIQKTYTLYSYGPSGDGSSFKVQMG
ncbi:unnamed protein product [Orchesella dallaii]